MNEVDNRIDFDFPDDFGNMFSLHLRTFKDARTNAILADVRQNWADGTHKTLAFNLNATQARELSSTLAELAKALES